MAELAVIIPAYNEEENIEKTLSLWSEVLEKLKIDYQIHIYNDGSKDSTRERIESFCRQNKKIKLHNQENIGHGPTLIKGYKENIDSTWIFQADSDNEIPPQYFSKMWEKRNNFDFLIGKRTNRKSPLTRKIVSFISRILVWIFYSKRIYDVNSPFRLMKTEKFKPLFKILPPQIFAPNLLVSGFAGYKRLSIFEFPVPYSKRNFGKESLNLKKLFFSSLRSFKETVSFRFRHLKFLKNE